MSPYSLQLSFRLCNLFVACMMIRKIIINTQHKIIHDCTIPIPHKNSQHVIMFQILFFHILWIQRCGNIFNYKVNEEEANILHVSLSCALVLQTVKIRHAHGANIVSPGQPLTHYAGRGSGMLHSCLTRHSFVAC